MSETREVCIDCDKETGRAGPMEDSIFQGSHGPLCEDCYDEWPEKQIELVQELTKTIRDMKPDADRFRWLLSGNGYFMEEQRLCGHWPADDKEQSDARQIIDDEIRLDERS